MNAKQLPECESFFSDHLALFSVSLCMYMAQTAARMESRKLFLCIIRIHSVSICFGSFLFVCCVCISVLGRSVHRVRVYIFISHFLRFCLLTSWFSARHRHRHPNTIQFSAECSNLVYDDDEAVVCIPISDLHANCGIDDDTWRVCVSTLQPRISEKTVVNHTKQ